MKIGAYYRDKNSAGFTVWAPFLNRVELKILQGEEKILPMQKDARGYWHAFLPDIAPGTRYCFRLEQEQDRPDPASHSQPEGVHGPSRVVNHEAFQWEDAGWNAPELSQMVIYELHPGVFTSQGTFQAIARRLPALKQLGINAIELMPVAQFPGGRNWGYDGVFPFAVQNSYGGPEGLKRLVNACHRSGIAVILDVVYNHLGPEGNYLRDFGPYFTDKYRTPWGMALNFDDAYSNEVRNFFVENALYWFRDFHIDALRLDAIHGISDMSAVPFLQELAVKVKEFCSREKRRALLIAESDLNDSRVMREQERGGIGLDAQWCDDFHHSLHTLLTGEQDGYYIDFGNMEHLGKSMREGFVYTGEYSEYRKRNHGNPSGDLSAGRFVFFSQNHDQIGNRAFGERLASLVSFESLKLAAGVLLLSPSVPLLFMGEEYGEEAPFLYFVSHGDPDLIAAVRKGRKDEFRSFAWKEEPPDPQDVETFLKSKLRWGRRNKGNHKVLYTFYRQLIHLRKKFPALGAPDRKTLEVHESEQGKLLFMRRWKSKDEIFCCFSFNGEDTISVCSLPDGSWTKLLDSSDTLWKGPGSLLPGKIRGSRQVPLRGRSFALYRRKIR
ncbi:MAG: malto-oligosyltrehalose trehalohydrolase [Nitrospirota bacterium]